MHKVDALRVSLASVPDRDDVVAELWAGDTQVAELARVGPRLVLQVYPAPSPYGWEFEYGAFLRGLEEMQARLRE